MRLLLLTIIPFLLFSCSQERSEYSVKGLQSKIQPQSISSWVALSKSERSALIQVVNQFNEPIENAQILVGSATDNPFKNNFLTTDKNGSAMVPSDWSTPEHVTVDAAGYIRQTLLNQMPGNITIKLNTAYLSVPAMITGEVTQLPVVNGDKNIDLGLVMSALTRADLLNFNLNLILSPFSDVLTVAGQSAQLPSNISLPTQKESYIFNLTISKPKYRYYSPTNGDRRILAAAGKFPFKTVVDELRNGKPFYEMINYFDLTGGGLRDVNVKSPSTNLDIPGNELKFNSQVKITSPQLNPDEVFITMAANEVSGYLIPTGIRKMDSKSTVTLNTMQGKPVYTLSAIKKQSEFMVTAPGSDRLSAAFIAYKAGSAPSLMPLINDPVVSGSNSSYRISLPAVSSTKGVAGIAVTVAISDIQQIPDGNSTVTQLIRKWEIMGNDWPKNIQLPKWPLSTSSRKRFDVNFIGSAIKSSVILGDDLVNSATHLTHSSVDY